MRQSLIPMLVLATVALSSSNVLPMSITHTKTEPYALDGQLNDNILSYKHQTRNNLDDLFYKIYVEHQNRPDFSRLQLENMDTDNNRDDDIFSIINKHDNYNGEGFRQEQWHNYPRQLDRLHKLYRHTDKRNFDPDPENEAFFDTAPELQNVNDITNEFHVDSNSGTNNIYDAVIAATNPLLILKIQLACLNKDIDINQYGNLISSDVENKLKAENYDFTNENPAMNVIKVKREGTSSQDSVLTETSSTETKNVKKRIFSLWSRLQSLNHKGHELHHRRHIHAFYSLPDSNGGGTLTAEPRAILMRPPGSPLRWG